MQNNGVFPFHHQLHYSGGKPSVHFLASSFLATPRSLLHAPVSFTHCYPQALSVKLQRSDSSLSFVLLLVYEDRMNNFKYIV